MKTVYMKETILEVQKLDICALYQRADFVIVAKGDVWIHTVLH